MQSISCAIRSQEGILQGDKRDLLSKNVCLSRRLTNNVSLSRMLSNNVCLSSRISNNVCLSRMLSNNACLSSMQYLTPGTTHFYSVFATNTVEVPRILDKGPTVHSKVTRCLNRDGESF